MSPNVAGLSSGYGEGLKQVQSRVKIPLFGRNFVQRVVFVIGFGSADGPPR